MTSTPAPSLAYRPTLEDLEDRCLLAADFRTLPIVPDIEPTEKSFLRGILANGLRFGNRLGVFSKIGDSITYAPAFLSQMGSPAYNPADPAQGGRFTGLADTINFFRSTPADASGANSFNRVSLAAFGGYTTGNIAAGGASALIAEIGVTRPAFALIMLGTNDIVLEATPEAFRGRLTTIAQVALSYGVVPVLSTIPDHLYAGGIFADRVGPFNQAIADVAEELQVPLWNYWQSMKDLPLHGISSDGVHPSVSPFGSGNLGDLSLLFGYNMRNLTAMQVLDKLKQVLLQDGPTDCEVRPLSAETVNFVSALYEQILHRLPTTDDVLYWGTHLNCELTRDELIAAIWQSPEHRHQQVEEYYLSYLNRNSEEAGRNYWVAAFQQGATEAEVKRAILTSPEYQGAHPTDEAFIQGVFRNVLERLPSQAEQQGFVDWLQQGQSRWDVTMTLLQSRPAADKATDKYYREYLWRYASTADFKEWEGSLYNGSFQDLQFAATLIMSAEYAQRHGLV